MDDSDSDISENDVSDNEYSHFEDWSSIGSSSDESIGTWCMEGAENSNLDNCAEFQLDGYYQNEIQHNGNNSIENHVPCDIFDEDDICYEPAVPETVDRVSERRKFSIAHDDMCNDKIVFFLLRFGACW